MNLHIFKKKNAFNLIEVTIALIVLLMLSWIMMKENITAIRQRLWGLKFVMAQNTLNSVRAQAQIIDKNILMTEAHPWDKTPTNALPEKVEIGRIPDSDPSSPGIEAYIIKSSTPNPNTFGANEIILHQAIIFNRNL